MTLQEYLKQRLRPGSVNAYLREIEIFLTNHPNAKKYYHADIVGYIGELRTKYNSARTVNRILSSIKQYYDFLAYTGVRADNPARSIRLRDKISRDIQLQDLFTQEELETLLYRKERFNALEYRNKVLMSLLIYQGLLPREITVLNIEDVNLQQGTVYIKGGHNTNARELTLKPNQVLLFYQYINEVRNKLSRRHSLSENEKALLIGVRNNRFTVEDIVTHLKRTYKGIFAPRKVNCKTIRQSVITNLLKQGHDITLVQNYAGHKYPGTTEKYKQNDVEQLQEALNKYHPFA